MLSSTGMLAKIFALIFLLLRLYILSEYAYNAVYGQEHLYDAIAFEFFGDLGTCALIVCCCFVIATWTEIVESVRSLENRKAYYRRVRLGLIGSGFAVTVVRVILEVISLTVIETADILFSTVKFLFAAFALCVFCLSVYNLVRTNSFWNLDKGQSKTIKKVRFKSKTLIVADILGFSYLVAGITSGVIVTQTDPWPYYYIYVVYRILEIGLLGAMFVFLQYYTFRGGGFLKGFRDFHVAARMGIKLSALQTKTTNKTKPKSTKSAKPEGSSAPIVSTDSGAPFSNQSGVSDSSTSKSSEEKSVDNIKSHDDSSSSTNNI